MQGFFSKSFKNLAPEQFKSHRKGLNFGAFELFSRHHIGNTPVINVVDKNYTAGSIYLITEKASGYFGNWQIFFEKNYPDREFKPEYVGKVNLYLEALDREVKKENENPSVGVILCASKDDEVVEFSLSRSLSPAMVSEYNLKLIDKALLQKKLKEYIELARSSEDRE